MSFFIGGLVFLVPERWRFSGAILVSCAMILVYAPFCKPASNEIPKLRNITDLKAWLYEHRPMDTMEYMPKQVKTIPPAGPANRFEVIKGLALIEPNGPVPSLYRAVTITTPTGAMIAFHQFYFPGWSISVDGKEAQIHADNPIGAMLFIVPAGTHQVIARFGPTPIRIAGETISVLMLLTLLFLSWNRKRLPRIL